MNRFNNVGAIEHNNIVFDVRDPRNHGRLAYEGQWLLPDELPNRLGIVEAAKLPNETDIQFCKRMERVKERRHLMAQAKRDERDAQGLPQPQPRPIVQGQINLARNDMRAGLWCANLMRQERKSKATLINRIARGNLTRNKAEHTPNQRVGYIDHLYNPPYGKSGQLEKLRGTERYARIYADKISNYRNVIHNRLQNYQHIPGYTRTREGPGREQTTRTNNDVVTELYNNRMIDRSATQFSNYRQGLNDINRIHNTINGLNAVMQLQNRWRRSMRRNVAISRLQRHWRNNRNNIQLPIQNVPQQVAVAANNPVRRRRRRIIQPRHNMIRRSQV